MYNDYINYLKNINDIKNENFKSHSVYNGILEHVSYDLGFKYLELIETEFNDINVENIIEFLQINDNYGSPNKYIYTFRGNRIACSPTSIRYIYHSLEILNHYKNTECRNIVEVGCGYGGLCLAINYFSKILKINIDNYNIIDLPDVCNLITKYLDVNKSYIYTNINIHSCETFGNDISVSNLFFISNYCYTEINEELNNNYSKFLLPKTNNGFIVWQNGGNKGSYNINNVQKITGKIPLKIIEEKPQTDAGYGIFKNYFVYF